MTKITKGIIIGFLILITLGLVWFSYEAVTGKNSLPVLGEPGHTAGPFSFTNQEGKQVTEKDIAGKVTVVEYFFTTCPGICKIMNSHLAEVYQVYKGRDDFAILSYTVDPETDSVPVLAAYAKKMNAELPAWQFMTGKKQDLYRIARQDYLLAVEDTIPPGAKEDFIHTEYVALLDQQRRIRGFYDATNKKSIKKLRKDIRSLLK